MFQIIKNTILEFMRLKVMYISIFVAILLIFLTYVLDGLTINQWNKAIIDFSLSIIEIFNVILTLFLWAYLLYNEFTKKTVLLILSKIKNKNVFIISKFFGFSIIIFFVHLFLTVWFLISIYFHWIDFEFFYLQAIFLIYLKVLVLLAFLIFFSTFVSPFLALLSSFVIYLVSHTSAFMLFFAKVNPVKNVSVFFEKIIEMIYYLLPNFHDLSMKEYFLSPNLSNYSNIHFLLSLFWGALAYIVVLLILSSWIFNKKEF